MVLETTIKISNELKEELDKLKLVEREPYNDVIKRIIKSAGGGQ